MASQMNQQPQYTLQSPSQQAPPEDMLFALERLLMGISPFPPSIPTLAKPTCPALDDNLMELAPTSSIPSIVLNEQSLDVLQQYYQSQDAQNMEFSDCSSTSRSASPPSSPYSYASSLTSSPCMPMEPLAWVPENNMLWSNDNNSTATIVPSSENNTWDLNLLEQMNMPWSVNDLEHYIAPSTPASAATAACILNQPKSLHQATSTRKAKTHRRTSSSSSALSAYESTARREHRASSISSVCSSTCSTTSSSRATKSYACPTCTKPFPTRTQLKSHMAIHTDSFPFPCLHAGCDLHFKRKHDLRRHVDAKHALVKKYLCTGGCGEGFGRRDQMVRHLRRGTCGQGFQTE
ncbi:hypothetical protein BGZ52_004018 [Haplosporangium bisporale]|nr:hypothetical protein BGZ52_004018 [Haplosporangium bisporale]